jgi:hypothetical protein
VSVSYPLPLLSTSFLPSDSEFDSDSDTGPLLSNPPVARPRHRPRPSIIMPTSTQVGHGLAKGLGIKLQYRNELDEEIRRGESVFSSATADTYVEEEPRSIDWLQSLVPSGRDILDYLKSLFPFLAWIGRYNLQWLVGDLIAGEYSIRIPVSQTNHTQVSRLVVSSFPREWHTLLSRTYLYNMACTLLSWVSSCIGSLRLRKILLSG